MALFEIPQYEPKTLKQCRTCAHRVRFIPEYGKVTQHCQLVKTKRNQAGLKRIRVYDVACENYREE